MAEEGTPITNSTATEVESSYEICQRSGFRVKRGRLVQEWDGTWVHPDFAEGRNQQDFIRSKAEKQQGATRPEPVGSETFIDSDNPVTADDL